MGSVNQVLELHILTLIAFVHFRKVMSMVSMIVIARSVLHDRSNPYSGKTECLDVVQFLNQSFEVATPSGVTNIVVLRVPTLGVIIWITIVETSGHHKINLLVTEIRTAWKQRSSHSRNAANKNQCKK